MTYTISTDKKIDILMEEYKQLYEYVRHDDKIASNKEAIFAVAAFGILALVLEKCLTVWPAAGAAVVSLALYLYHVLAFNRMSFFGSVKFYRLQKIEARIKKLSGLNNDDKTKGDENSFLLEDFRQAYEQFRHCDNISQGKEAIYAVAAFGVLALVIKMNLMLGFIIGAAVVSR